MLHESLTSTPIVRLRRELRDGERRLRLADVRHRQGVGQAIWPRRAVGHRDGHHPPAQPPVVAQQMQDVVKSKIT
jgi:hypothetical protein